MVAYAWINDYSTAKAYGGGLDKLYKSTKNRSSTEDVLVR